MGWTVLYVAFGVVALWLLGEVLLQHKARLRWRLLAFVGFLGVVVGVALPSILVIALGAVAFAVGQTLVTLSFRQGFTTGWALPHPLEGRRRGGGGGRRRSAGGAPALHVSDVEPVPETSPAENADGSAAPGQAAFDGSGGHGSPFDGGYDAPQDPYAPYAGADEGTYADQDAAHHGHWEDPARELLQDEDVFRAREHIAGGEPWQAAPGHAPQPLPEETGGYGYAPAAATGPGDTGYGTAWDGGHPYPDGYAPPGGQAPGYPDGAGYDTSYGYGTGQDGHGGYDGGQQGGYGGYDTGQGGYGGPGGYQSGYDGYPAAPGTHGYDDLAPYGGEQRPDAYPGYPQDAYPYDARGGDPSAAPHPYQDQQQAQPYQDSYQGGGWQDGSAGSYQPYEQSPFDPPAPGYGQSPFDPPAPGYGQGPDGAWLPPQRGEGQDPPAQTAHQEPQGYPGYGGDPEDPYGHHPGDRQTYRY